MIARRTLLLSSLGLAAWPARAQSRDETWTDSQRRRDLPLRLRWPDGPGPWPLLLFSHGLGGSRDGGELWGQAWRDAGFVVVHLQHPGSDTAAWAQGMASLRAAASAQQFIARIADVKFVLDEVARRHAAREGGWSQVRLDAIGMSGHSFGAQTTAALAGKRYAVDTSALVDERPRAFMAFSPSLTPGRMTPDEQFGAVRRPFMCLTGSLDGDPLGNDKTGDRRWQVYEGLPDGAKAGLWLDGADHMSFGGQARTLRALGPLGVREPRVLELEPAHQALIASLSTLWWRARLMHDSSAAAALQSPMGLGPSDRWLQA
jgi:predicted dienelactone hydrolase